jgi:hypothetical protein
MLSIPLVGHIMGADDSQVGYLSSGCSTFSVRSRHIKGTHCISPVYCFTDAVSVAPARMRTLFTRDEFGSQELVLAQVMYV